MAARPFKIDKPLPPPPSVEHTAERYGVSKSSLQQIKTFVSGFLNGGEPERTRSTIGGKRTVRLAVRKSGAMRRSAPVRRTAGSGRTIRRKK